LFECAYGSDLLYSSQDIEYRLHIYPNAIGGIQCAIGEENNRWSWPTISWVRHRDSADAEINNNIMRLCSCRHTDAVMGRYFVSLLTDHLHARIGRE
jgi:hypothetical protein